MWILEQFEVYLEDFLHYRDGNKLHWNWIEYSSFAISKVAKPKPEHLQKDFALCTLRAFKSPKRLHQQFLKDFAPQN